MPSPYPLALWLKKMRRLAALSALVGLSIFGLPAHAESSSPAAETLEQAERRMAMIEAMGPPSFPSETAATKDLLANIRRREAEEIRVFVDLLANDGTPVRREPDTAETARFSTSIGPTDTSFVFRHWETGYAPDIREIILPASDLAAARAAAIRETRIVTAPPITLKKGATASVRLQGPDGRPLKKAVAAVRARPREGQGADLSWRDALWMPGFIEANSEGRIVVENITERFDLLLQVWAPGFLPSERIFENPAGNEDALWSLTPSPLLRGRVVDARTREPLVGVQVKFTGLYSSSEQHPFRWDQLANIGQTISDTGGYFTLPSLPVGWQGGAILKRDGYADLSLGDLARSGVAETEAEPETTREYAMQPGHRLAGHVRVPAGFLRDQELFTIEAIHDETHAVDSRSRPRSHTIYFWKKQNWPASASPVGRNEFDPEATDIPFAFPKLPEGRFRLRAFFSAHQLFAEAHIDLASDQADAELTIPVANEIEVSLVLSSGETAPVRGRLGYYRTDGTARKGFGFGVLSGDSTLPIVAGKAAGVLYGDRHKRQVVLVDQFLVGYRFARKPGARGHLASRTFDLPENGSPLRVTIPVEPAGAFRVRLLEDDDQLAPDGKGEVAYWFLGPEYSQGGGARAPYANLLFTPLPLQGECELVVQRGHRIVTTGKIALTPETPAIEHVLRFPPGTRVAGRILDSEGRPVAGGKVRLGYQYLQPQPTMLLEAAERLTGPDGEFSFEGINLDLPNPWWVETVPEPVGPPTMPRHRTPLDKNAAQAVELRLPEVHETAGRLLDYETNQPLPGITVEAFVWIRSVNPPPVDRPQWTNLRQPAMAETDADGVFRFRNLPAGPYALRLSFGEIVTKRDRKSVV